MVKFSDNKLKECNLKEYNTLISPRELKNEIKISKEVNSFINKGRKEIIDIIEGVDKRKIIITGPCSIHDYKEALEYAKKLKALSEKVSDKFLIVMRTYFEKPRSSVGWKGLISDPNLDGTNDYNQGLKLARKVLLDINKLGVLCASEFLSVWIANYIEDLVSWVAIGARTTESQPHREMASGLCVPVGFKNTTNGDVDSAINAVIFSMKVHSFLGLNEEGCSCLINTKGNQHSHIILRGGNDAPNYYNETVCKVCTKLEDIGLPVAIIVDCSHANSGKNFERQPYVFREVMEQIIDKMECSYSIKGVMLESNLNQGNQEFVEGKKDKLKRGVSITDSCISWETTEKIILDEYERLNINN